MDITCWYVWLIKKVLMFGVFFNGIAFLNAIEIKIPFNFT